MFVETKLTTAEIKKLLTERLEEMGFTPKNASDEMFYKACAGVVRKILTEKHNHFMAESKAKGRKQTYYLCMEFLLGRSLKNSIYNLNLAPEFQEALKEMGVKMENLFELEPDAGLGNGGLGRLAACFMDALATCGYPAIGYSILYEFGIFKQKIIDGWQSDCRTTGCQAARYGWSAYRNRPLMLTLAARSRNSGTMVTIMSCTKTTPLSKQFLMIS